MTLQEFRKQKKLTQAEFAQILQVDQRDYNRLEKSESILSIKRALLIANHFHISLDEIYNDYIEQDEREQGVTDTLSINVTADEDNLLTIYRKIGKEFGKGAQQTYLQMGETLLNALKGDKQ